MSKLLPLIAVVLSAAALASALLRPTSPVEQPAIRADDEGLAALDRRLELLEETTHQLEQRVAELGRKPGITAAEPGSVPAGLAEQVAQLRTEVHGMIAGEALQSEGGKAYLRDAVRGVQEDLASEERKARAERLADVMARTEAGDQARWKKFVTEAGLNYTQEQSLKRLLEVEATTRRTTLEQMRAGTRSFTEVRAEMRATSEQTDQAMKASLNAEQFEKYAAQRHNDRRGPRGGGRPPP